MSGILEAQYFILFLVRIISNKKPFQFSAYYEKRDEIYFPDHNWPNSPTDSIGWIFLYLFTNKYTGIVD